MGEGKRSTNDNCGLSTLVGEWILALVLLEMGKVVFEVVDNDVLNFVCRFAIVAADASAGRSILVFKHDVDKVSIHQHKSLTAFHSLLFV